MQISNQNFMNIIIIIIITLLFATILSGNSELRCKLTQALSM